jgi:gluconate 5-dehydrogenase
MSHFDLSGRLALVTGASRGIGRGIAAGLAAAGASVIFVARSEPDLQVAQTETRAALSSAAAIHYSVCDLTNVAGLAAWYQQIIQQFGTPDILVNAAGTTRRGMALEQSLADFEYLQTLNVTSVYELSRLFAQQLVRQEMPGRVINIASLMSFASRPGTAAYTASKGAVAQLTKALALEWGPLGILVNAIAPGYIATPLTAALVEDEKFTAWVKQRCPLQRWGTPEDLAGPAVFLASEAARFVNGQVLAVDGGWLAGL